MEGPEVLIDGKTAHRGGLELRRVGEIQVRMRARLYRAGRRALLYGMVMLSMGIILSAWLIKENSALGNGWWWPVGLMCGVGLGLSMVGFALVRINRQGPQLQRITAFRLWLLSGPLIVGVVLLAWVLSLLLVMLAIEVMGGVLILGVIGWLRLQRGGRQGYMSGRTR